MKLILGQYSGLKKEIYILFIGKLVTAMGSFVWPMITFLLTTKLGLSDGVATMLIATAGVLSLPVTVLGGKLADQFSRKWIIVIFDFLTVSLYLLASFLPIGYHTAAIVFFASLFQSLESPAYDALTADYSGTAQREKAYSLTYLGFNLGFIFGASVSGVLFEKYIDLAFKLNAVSIFISTILIFFFVHPKNAIREASCCPVHYGVYEHPVDEKISVLSVLKDRKAVLYFLLVGCIASITNNTVGILLPLQLKEELGQAGATLYGYLNSLNGLTVVFCTPILTMLLRKKTEIPKSILGMLLYVSGMVMFFLNCGQWILFIGMFVYTSGEVVTTLGTSPYTSRRVPASHRGRIGGLSSVLSSAFSTLTQYGISYILTVADGQYNLLWVVFIACGLLTVALYAALYPADRRRFPLLYTDEAER